MAESDRYSDYRIKKSWRDRLGRDAITILIAIHIIAFVFFLLVLGIYKVAGADSYDLLMSRFAIPTSLKAFLFQPWSIFTYSITEVYSNFFRLLYDRPFTKNDDAEMVFTVKIKLGIIGIMHIRHI